MELPSSPPSPKSGDASVFNCFYCNSPESPNCLRSIIGCMDCLLVSYCSFDCLNDDSICHKPVCKEFPAVNGNSVLHTTKSWKKHITDLRKRAARLPMAVFASIPIFKNPKVCHTCHEARINLLKLCKCGCVCYCSEICAYTDKLHLKSCNKLRNLKSSYSIEFMRRAYPESLYGAYLDIENFGPDQLCQDDLITLNIHVVSSTAYYDAESWEMVFDHFPKLEQLNLVFVIQGMDYNPSYDKSETLTIHQLEENGFESRNGILSYSVHQKPYHMFFSSSEYTEPDLVVAFGIPYTHMDIHSAISYRNMTYCKHTVLVLMDSTEDLVAQGVQDVNAVRPVNVLSRPKKNKWRRFGSYRSEMDFDLCTPNVRRYIACLCSDLSRSTIFLNYFEND